jgi:polyphosphate kinase
MTRNLNRRVEVTFPVYDADLRRQIHALIELQLRDNQKARVLDATQSNPYAKSAHGGPVRAQMDTYRLLQAQRRSTREPMPRSERRIDHTNPAHA